VRRRKRVFKQERARETYEGILRAAAKVFAKHGFEKAQAPDIARAAGVSTGAVYRYFTDKREIFLEMVDDELGAARKEVEKRLAPEHLADPRAAIDAVLGVFFARAKRDPALTRVYLAMSLRDPDVAALRAESEARDREVVAALIGAVVPASRIPDPKAAAFVLQSAALAVAVGTALQRGAEERAVRAELASMLHRYLWGD
jgi:AcrR family transcriptional regulator